MIPHQQLALLEPVECHILQPGRYIPGSGLGGEPSVGLSDIVTQR